ncbi:hypothetical protein C461_12703 [Halorubrum aidingense JCM 13560]|uniref:DUF8103 domain-containing protein n=1 Tax=Halorubrum aidingense JCM 13560 TaxID=1230454 RepID=M0P916_9EURY|nr:hypothetical protein [Halorubrum aidingense]EMA66034.1 hypothetical protein C461_12703 [Halorubrum aidingense JCM 13560]
MSIDEEVPELDWAVIKSLMDAQANTNTSLERYLLYVTHDDFDLDERHMERCLSQAINHHQRALEDLKTARDLVASTPD